MRKFIFITLICFAFFSFQKASAQNTKPSKNDFVNMLEQYYKERMKLLPLESTVNGEKGNNDKLYADFTDSYRQNLKEFFSRYLSFLQKIDKSKLNANDQLSYDIFNSEMLISIDGIDIGYFCNNVLYPDDRYIPFNQFGSLPNFIGRLGSGEGAQPFKTVKDYSDWQMRVTAFSDWVDSAIIYFRRGIAKGIVLPHALVVKMIPQIEAMLVSDPTKSLFYGPISKLPDHFSEEDKKKLTKGYILMINDQIIPTYRKLADFLKTEYLSKARKTSGIGAIPYGDEQYRWLIRFSTTTDKSPDEIYQTGLAEVKRIRELMESVRNAVGFTGDLKAFFAYMKTDKQFMPFKTPEEVLNAYRSVETRINPNLSRMFNHVPKTKFEVRQTEAYRAASASAEYFQGLADGSRPGIFYVPILDATKFNVTTGIEGLFLHEAIPGHHYQISLQSENEMLPTFRRFYFSGAYVEGWGLYSESLGKELGIYTDPYQYMAALGKEMHRAIRLVVDVGIHKKGWTREQSIQYMMDNMPLDEAGTIAEIERYMAIPAQALSYKIGSLKIQELRKKYEKQMGSKFKLAEFHDAILDDGAMPLHILENKLDVWAKTQK